MTTHHPKFSIHTALQLFGLTTEKSLPTAKIVSKFKGIVHLHINVKPQNLTTGKVRVLIIYIYILYNLKLLRVKNFKIFSLASKILALQGCLSAKNYFQSLLAYGYLKHILFCGLTKLWNFITKISSLMEKSFNFKIFHTRLYISESNNIANLLKYKIKNGCHGVQCFKNVLLKILWISQAMYYNINALILNLQYWYMHWNILCWHASQYCPISTV